MYFPLKEHKLETLEGHPCPSIEAYILHMGNWFGWDEITKGINEWMND
jgi:hypothetical protein